MKKIVVLFLFVTILFSGCSGQQEVVQKRIPYDFGMLDVEKTFNTLDEIASDSTLIVHVTLQDQSEVISYGGADFSLSKLYIQKMYKGDAKLVNTTINLLELSTIDIKKDQGNGMYLLFLKPYEGPIVSNAYVISGVYQGRFKYDNDDKLIYDAEKYRGINKFQQEFVKNFKSELAELQR